MNSKGVRGCVTANNPESIGFHKVPYSVRSIDDCMNIAKKSGIICDPNNQTCSHFIFSNRTLDDKLREGQKHFEEGNIDNALNIHQQAWRAMSPQERKNELLIAEKSPDRFMAGFGHWIAKDPKYLHQFRSTQNSDTQPLPLEGSCFIGGNKVMDSNDVVLSEEMGMSSKNCRYNLFEVPTGENGNAQQQMVNMYKRRLASDKKQLEDLKEKLRKDQIALEIAQKHNNPVDMIVEAKKIETDMKNESVLKPYKDSLVKMKRDLENHIKNSHMFNYINDVTSDALQNSKKLVTEKEKVNSKITSDINNINWSLEEANRQEQLQNKITSTLSIIIVLFVFLVVGLITYYMIYEKPGMGMNIKPKVKTDSNVISNIFTPKKTLLGTTKNKGIIDNIFGFK